MRSLVYFLTILHITIGQIQNVYDAQSCGISQINDYAQNSTGRRVRRSSLADAQSIDQTTNDDVAYENLDENATWDQDDNDFMQEKVMGGRRAARGEIPWAVFLRTPGDLCGGTLVSRRHVITAAHCFWASNRKMGKCNISDMYSQEKTINSTEVYVGGSCSFAGAYGCNTSDIGKLYRVARASYEQYFAYGCKGTYDIAILELTEDAPETINHVCLPFMHQVEEIEDPYLKLRSFGWGLDPLKYPGLPSPYLQIAELGAKLPEEKCNKMKNWKANDTFCTTSGQQYICQGDSGGGVTATIRERNYLMGLNSYGPNCIRVAKGKAISHPQVSTDIMHYEEIIKSWILTKRENQSIATNKIKWQPQVPNTSHTTPLPQPVTDENWKGILTKSENQLIATNKITWQPQVPNTSHKTPLPQPVTDQNWKEILKNSENQSIATNMIIGQPQVPNTSHETTPLPQPVTDQNWKAQYSYSGQDLKPPSNTFYPVSQSGTSQNWKTQYPYGSQNLNPPTNMNYPQFQPMDQSWRAQYPYGSQVSHPSPNIPYPLSQPVTNHYGEQYQYGSQTSNSPTNVNYPQSQLVTNQYGAQYLYGSQVSNPLASINYLQSQPVTNQYRGGQYQYGSQASNSPTNINYPQSQLVTNQYGAQHQYGSKALNPLASVNSLQSQPVTNQYMGGQYQYGSQASNSPTNINYLQSQPITNQYGSQYQYGSKALYPLASVNYLQSQPVANQYRGGQYQYGSQASNSPTNINYLQSQPVTNHYGAQYQYGSQTRI